MAEGRSKTVYSQVVNDESSSPPEGYAMVQSRAAADIILYNGKVLTVDAADTIQKAP